jgi:hypothetical protein
MDNIVVPRFDYASEGLQIVPRPQSIAAWIEMKPSQELPDSAALHPGYTDHEVIKSRGILPRPLSSKIQESLPGAMQSKLLACDALVR